MEGTRHQDCRPTHSVERTLTESGAKVDTASITGLSRGLGQLIRWRGCIKVTRKEPMTQDRSNGTCEVKFSAGGPERGRLRKNLKRKAMCAQDEWP